MLPTRKTSVDKALGGGWETPIDAEPFPGGAPQGEPTPEPETIPTPTPEPVTNPEPASPAVPAP